MLNDKTKNEWKLKVKSIFTEAQKKFTEDAENGGLDLGGSEEEDPALAAPVDGEVDPSVTTDEEDEPTVTVTASLLKALLDYCSAPDEEEISDLDNTQPVDETMVNPSMSAPAMNTNSGIMENELPPEESADDVDDVLSGDEDDVSDDTQDADVSSDEIVQRLLDLSAENEGAPLDVDVLSVVFAPADDETDDLGDADLDGNVQLPATTGDQTLPPTV